MDFEKISCDNQYENPYDFMNLSNFLYLNWDWIVSYLFINFLNILQCNLLLLFIGISKFKLFFIIIIKSGEIFILDGNIFFPPNDGDVKLLHQVNHLNSHKSSYSKDLILKY